MSGRTTKRCGSGIAWVHGEAYIVFWRRLYEATDKAVTKWINRPRIGDTRPHTAAPVFKPREHFKADGTPKVRMTKDRAKQYVEQHAGFRAYPCSVCKAWHVGHKVKAKLVAA